MDVSWHMSPRTQPAIADNKWVGQYALHCSSSPRPSSASLSHRAALVAGRQRVAHHRVACDKCIPQSNHRPPYHAFAQLRAAHAAAAQPNHARMGGDEFVLVLPGLAACDLPEKLNTLEKVVVDAGVAVCGERLLAISAGAAFFPQDGADAENLLAEADRSMYRVKQSRKGVASSMAHDLAALAMHIDQPKTSQHTAH